MQELCDQFLREKLYLYNASPRTIKYLSNVLHVWRKHAELPTKDNLKEWVIKLIESGISPATVNSYIRGLNTFLTWLHNEKGIEKLRIKPIKEEKPTLKTFSEKRRL
ncbi:MAG TPA: hypothetical protein VF779_10020 [Pyrinomonadaceae bacterium]